MKAVILAGGRGTRLAPLTDNLPKPMMPIGGTPVIGHIAKLLFKHGFEDITVALQYQPQCIINYLSPSVGDFVIEDLPLGTAGSVKNAILSPRKLECPILIVSGDALTNINLQEMLSFHIRSGALVTMASQRVSDPSRFGVIITEPNGRITAFQEKPERGEELSDIINCGIYLIEPQVLKLIPSDSFFDFAKDLFPLMLRKQLPMYSFAHSYYWRDIGSLSDLHCANMDCLTRKFDFLPHDELQTGANIINSVVPKSATILRGNIVDSVVFDDTVIEGDLVRAIATSQQIIYPYTNTVISSCKNQSIGL